MKKKTLSRAARLALTVALVLMLLVPTASASEYYAIVDSFGKKARNASLDVACDLACGSGLPEILFEAYSATGTQLAQFSVTTNANGLASSAWFANLFELSGGQPLLVRARTPGAGSSAATLAIDSLGAPMTVGILPTSKLDGTPLSMGRLFSIALPNYRSASVLIANVANSDALVDVFKGTGGAPGTGFIHNPRLPTHHIWRVDLTQNEALSHLIVSANNNIIVQVVIDDGRSIQSFMVTPIAVF